LGGKWDVYVSQTFYLVNMILYLNKIVPNYHTRNIPRETHDDLFP